MSERVSISIEDGVADIRLSRPDKRNAFDDAMFEAVNGAIADMAAREDVRAVVLSGEGPAFCAGLDLGKIGEMASGQMQGGEAVNAMPRMENGANHAQQVALGWRDLDIPVIAALHGHAIGAGFQLALGADLRFAAGDVKLSAFEINWGLVPDMGAFVLLRRLVRDDVLADLLFTGRTVEGEEALAIGLVSRICSDPREEALAYAREIAGKSPQAVRAAKRMMRLSAGAGEREILIAETREMAALIGSPDQVETVMAKMEKRAPKYA